MLFKYAFGPERTLHTYLVAADVLCARIKTVGNPLCVFAKGMLGTIERQFIIISYLRTNVHQKEMHSIKTPYNIRGCQCSIIRRIFSHDFLV